VVVAGFLLWNAFERYTVAAEMSERRDALQQTATALQARQTALQEQVQYLQDERGIEAQMRRQFDVALPGEEVVVIVEEETPPEILPLATTTEQRAWWQLW